MEEQIKEIINEYLILFPEENNRLQKLNSYLSETKGDITDWNNFEGHLTVGAFIFCENTKEFLLLKHKDLDMYLYPGGHIDSSDSSLLDAAKRELLEETGITNATYYNISSNYLIPLDIDTHIIPQNERLNLPAHYHFDFRYLFYIKDKESIIYDKEEISSYKWISEEELSNHHEFGLIIDKINNIRKV